jgi:hypothetical protein
MQAVSKSLVAVVIPEVRNNNKTSSTATEFADLACI